MAYVRNLEIFSPEDLKDILDESLKKAKKKSFYLTNELTREFYTKLVKEFGQILTNINNKKKVTEEELQKLTKLLSNVRNQMMDELIKEKVI